MDYIWFKQGQKNKSLIQKRSDLGLNWLEVWLPLDKNADKVFNKIKRKYELCACGIGSDCLSERKLGLQDIQFQARKKEFMQHQLEIMRYLSRMEKSGSSFLVVLESRLWNKQELKTIIRNAKDYYEYFFIEDKVSLLFLEELVEEIYEEEGIVVTIITKKEEKMRKYHFVCFLLEEWEETATRGYYFFQGYAVTEKEEKLKRVKKSDMIKDKKMLPNNIVYSGLVYQGKKGILPYQMAVNLLCQNPIISQKINLSFVAIYSVECYNKL